MDLLYPFLETGEGIKTNVTNVLFNFILPLIPKEIYSLNNVTIYRTERSLSSLETKICSNPLTAFCHRHIVQPFCEKDSSGKHTKDWTMVTIPSSQNEWTNNLTDAPSKIIINDKLTPLAVKSNIHIIDVLIKEVLTDSPLLIIKENINCGKFLDKDKFNLLTGRIRYKSLTDFP